VSLDPQTTSILDEDGYGGEMTDKQFAMTPPTVTVREDGAGDLFTSSLTEYDEPYSLVLDASQSALWDAYVEACRAQQEAARVVRAALRKPTKQELRRVTTAAPSGEEARG
jgi:hypothetical protein